MSITFLGLPLFVLILLTNSTCFGNGIRFFEGDFEQLKSQAKSTNKPFFICFYKDGCISSQKMNDVSFNDETVINYVSNNYVAYKIDVQSFEGFNLAAKFDVHQFPNVTIFTPKGEPIYEIEGYQDPETLIGNLSTEAQNMKMPGFCPGHAPHYQPTPKKNTAYAKIEYPTGFQFDVPVTQKQEGLHFRSQPPVENENRSIANLDVDRYAKKIAPQVPQIEGLMAFNEPRSVTNTRGIAPSSQSVKTTTTTRGIAQPSTTTPVKTAKPISTTSKETVNKRSIENNPKYAIQIGAFKEEWIAKEQVQNYKSKGLENVQIKTTKLEEQTLHKILVGSFPSRSAAQTQADTLKSQGIECFIVTL